MLKYFIILVVIKQSLACSGLQTRKTCTCSYKYTYENEPLNYREIAFPIQSYDDCGISLTCEKRLDCMKYCRNKVNLLLGNEESVFNQIAKNKLCSLLLKNESLSSNGLILRSYWQYSNCESGFDEIISNLCCNPRCKCELIGQNNAILSTVLDMNRYLPVKQKAYDCSVNEFFECEKDCRSTVSTVLKNQQIASPINQPVPNYNILTAENYASELLCEELRKDIKKPGLEMFVKISTDPKVFNEIGKYLPIGRLCCNRKCNCELYTQNGSIVSSQLEKNILLVNLTDRVLENRKKSSFECQNEELDCMKECRLALAGFLQSDLLLVNQTTIGLVTSNVDILAENTPSIIMCERINRSVTPPGLNIYLRFSSNELSFPFKEEMHVGRICCFYFNGRYVPFNRCLQYP